MRTLGFNAAARHPKISDSLMSTKSPPTDEAQRERTEALPGDEVMLPDESDAIIANLKNQLHSLQQQLDYPPTAGGGPPGLVGGEASQERILDGGMTVRIASRLEIPAEELTARLERVIEQIHDPDLKAELIHARETAFFLFDTFRHINASHDQLTQSLTAEIQELDRDDFLGRLEASLHDRNLPVTVEGDASLPGKIGLPPSSVITILATLARLAVDIFDRPGTARVSCTNWGPPNNSGEGTLELRLSCERSLPKMARDEAVSAAIIRSGVRSRSVVDLLYVEKIIEMRGGQLEFLRKGDEVNGFKVSLPVTVPPDA